MENHHAILMGKSTMSTGPFSSSQTVNVYQAGYIIDVEHPLFPSENDLQCWMLLCPIDLGLSKNWVVEITVS